MTATPRGGYETRGGEGGRPIPQEAYEADLRRRLQRVREDDERERREEIQRVMTYAAQWGYEMDQLGMFSGSPEPVIKRTRKVNRE